MTPLPDPSPESLAGRPPPRVTAKAGLDPDAVLVEGCRRSDPESLRGLMERHGARVLGLVQRIVKDHEAAEALTQETFLKVFRNIHRFKPGTKFGVWLLTIARNAAYDHLRRRKSRRLQPVDLAETPEPVDPEPGPAETVERRETEQAMRQALARLPAREREVVFLRIHEGLTWDAIAAALNIPEATARARMNRALARLRVSLGRLR